jgi:DNA-binding NtrC family response regulator
MKPKILVVDNPEGCDNFRKDLLPRVQERWDVTFATSAKEAFQLLQQGQTSVVVCGICLPDIDCISLSHEINSAFPKVQVVLNGASKNGHSCGMSRQDFIQTPAIGFISEAQEEPEMIEQIEIAIHAKGMKDTGFF